MLRGKCDDIRPVWEWLIPVILCGVMLGELFFCSRQLSQTSDEATHLYSGYRYLKCGDLTLSPEHPPLAKIVAAMPLLVMNPSVNCAPFRGTDVDQAFASLRWFYSNDWHAALFWGRMAVSMFAIGLCILVWITARRMFGFTVAVMATLILVFEPNVLASGVLIMTDLAPATMMLSSVLAFYLWTRTHTPILALLTGVAVGLTLLSKTSGVAVIPTIFVLAAVDIVVSKERTPPHGRVLVQHLFAITLIVAVAFGVLWAGYGMRYAINASPDPIPKAALSTTGSLAWFEGQHLLPEGYIQSLAFVQQLSGDPTRVFFLGKLYPHAQWFFFPANVLIRCTVGCIGMILLASAGFAMCWRQHKREVLFLLVPVVIFTAACVHSRINSGIRHLLPAFPFLVILIAVGCVEMSRRLSWMKYAIIALITLHVASSLRAFPDYLSYANEIWGGPEKAYKYLPSIDAGQSYVQVRNYMEKHPSEKCWLLTNWQWDPQIYGLNCKVLGYWKAELIPPRMSGTIIVSSSALTSPLLHQAVARDFEDIPPAGYIGGSAMLLYEGDFDTRSGASLSAAHLAMEAIERKRFNDALQLSNYAIQMWPENPYAHADRANALMMIGQSSGAIQELERAQTLLRNEGDRAPAEEVSTIDQALQTLRNSQGGY